MQTSEEHLSARDGAEEEFDPCRQAQFVLKSEGLHQGVAAESMIEVLLRSEAVHVTDLPLPEGDRNLLASILMKDDEELSAERLEGRGTGPAAHPTQEEAGAGAEGTAGHARAGSRPDSGPFGGKDAA